MIEFEWDPYKANDNRRDYRVTFEEASTVLHAPTCATEDEKRDANFAETTDFRRFLSALISPIRVVRVLFFRAVFGDILSAIVPDPDHSDDEDRYVIIGLSRRRRLLLVSFTDRNGRVRIISARELTAYERREWENGDF